MPRFPSKTLITGATGHVGANLLHTLAADPAHELRVLVRPGENDEALDGLPQVEKVVGDLRDEASLVPAVRGVRRIFHVASMVSTIDGTPAQRRALYETNVMGTRYLLRQAKAAGVERTVVTSSFSAVGYDLDDTATPASEDFQFYPYHRAMPYERSKVLQEHEVLKAVVDGQDAVICTSTAIIGGHDYLPSRLGTTMCEFANRKVRAYVPGGFMFVAARDLVEGHLLAMEKGRRGHKYIIGTTYMELEDLLRYYSEISGQPMPPIKLPNDVLEPLAEIFSFVATRVAPGFMQKLTPGAIRRLKLRRRADIRKAVEELGYQPTDIYAAIREAYAFHWSRGAISHPHARPPRESEATPSSPSADSSSASAPA